MEDFVPDSFSWKTSLDSIIPIRDQKLSPCSWAFAAATLVSYELRIRNNKVWDFEASAQHLIDQCQTESSEMLNKTRCETIAVLQYIKEHAVSLQSRYPYRARKFSKQAIPKGPKIRIRNIVHLSKNTPLADIKNILLAHPIIASIEVYRGLLSDEFPRGQEDVYVENTGTRVLGSHYLLIIGYGNQDGKDFYEVHNSWGLAWGNSGYGRIACQLVRPFGYVTEAYIDG